MCRLTVHAREGLQEKSNKLILFFEKETQKEGHGSESQREKGEE